MVSKYMHKGQQSEVICYSIAAIDGQNQGRLAQSTSILSNTFSDANNSSVHHTDMPTCYFQTSTSANNINNIFCEPFRQSKTHIKCVIM